MNAPDPNYTLQRRWTIRELLDLKDSDPNYTLQRRWTISELLDLKDYASDSRSFITLLAFVDALPAPTVTEPRFEDRETDPLTQIFNELKLLRESIDNQVERAQSAAGAVLSRLPGHVTYTPPDSQGGG